jgi:transposase
MRKVREILRLAHEGLPLRQIGAALGVPFTTAGDHLRRAERAGLAWPLPDELDDVALEALLYPKGPAPEPCRPLADWSHVHRELRRPGVTLMLLWHEYRADHPDGYSYSQFCLHYRAFQRRLDLPMRQEHQAGERLFVDFPGQLLPIYDRRSGEVSFEAELFVAVLGASSFLHAEAVASQSLEHWIGAHVHAFESLGCVPRVVVYENVPRNIFGLLWRARLCGRRQLPPCVTGGDRLGWPVGGHINGQSEASQASSAVSSRQTGRGRRPSEELEGSVVRRASIFALVLISA